MANELNVKIVADISSLKAALEEAQAQVKTASANMAEAQEAFGASAALGNEQAQTALAGYAGEVEIASGQVKAAKTALAEATAASAAFAESQGATAVAEDAVTGSTAAEVAALNNLWAASNRQVSGSAAAQGALRTLEGSMFGASRAAGTLLADTLGLGPILQAAFPVIGAVALLSILYQVGEELYKTITKAQQAGEEISRAFGDANEKIEASTDAIQLQNSKLQDEIDKLEGHPNNGLQTALLEALDAADKLQASLEGDSKALADLLKKQEVGYLAGAISGVAPTVPEDKKLTKITTDVQEEGRGALLLYRQQLEAAGKDQKLSESATKTYYDSIAAITAAGVEKVQPILQHSYDMQRENNERIENLRRLHIPTAVSAAVGGPVDIDFSAQVNAAQGALTQLQDIQAKMQAMAETEPLQEKKGGNEQARERAAAAKKASEDHLRDLEDVFSREELQYGISANQTEAYWGQYVNDTRLGADQQEQVLEKVVRAQEQMGRSVPLGHIGEGLKKAAEQAKEDSKKYVEALDDMRKATVEWQKADAQAAAAAAQHQHDLNLGALEIQGAKVEQASAVGTQTPKTELTDLQALHAQEIAEDERFILEEMAIYAKEPAELDRLQKELDAVHQKGQLQQVEDTTKSLEQQLQLYKQAYSAITSDLNQTIDKLITTTERPAQAFARMFDKILEQLANFVLQWLEKQAGMWLQTEIMQLLGITKQATQQTAQTTAVIAAQTAQTTAVTAAQTAQTAAIAAAHATQAASNVAIVTGDAAVAAANTMAFYTLTAPPAAPALAAAAFAATEAYAGLAAFEAGGVVSGASSLPVPILAHAGERVLSAPQTQNFERLVNQPQGGGHSTTLNYSPNINAYDRTGFRSVMQEHSDDLFEMIRQGYAQGKLT